jgi:hypothetical protein
MTNMFYVIEQAGNFKLMLKDRHYCLSASADKEVVFNKLREYVLKYKTRSRFLRRIDLMCDGGHVPERTLIHNQGIYESKAMFFEDEVLETVKQALKEVKERDNPLKKLLHKSFITPAVSPAPVPPVIHRTAIAPIRPTHRPALPVIKSLPTPFQRTTPPTAPPAPPSKTHKPPIRPLRPLATR